MINLRKKIGIIAILCIFLDQLSKLIIVNTFNLYQNKEIIKNFFSLTYVKNTGAAWSILDGKVPLLIIITIISLIFIIRFVFKDENVKKIDAITYGMLLGGIIGNLIDRIAYGYVIDFLSFIIIKYNFPVFNIADSLIVVSVFLMIITSFWGEKNENNSR